MEQNQPNLTRSKKLDEAIFWWGFLKFGKYKTKLGWKMMGEGLQFVAMLLMIPNDVGQALCVAQSSRIGDEFEKEHKNKAQIHKKTQEETQIGQDPH